MRTLIALTSVLFLFYLTPAQAHSKAQPDASIVSALPVLHALNQALLNGTPVKAIYLPPKRLPVSRIGNWLQHKSGNVISGLEPVTALTTIESVWPEQALLKHLRANNVAVIELDAASELLNGGARISLSREDTDNRTSFWMAPDNLQVMSQILARDMQRIWPRYAATIRANQLQLQQQVRDYALQMDQWLIDHDLAEICLLSPELMPLARATNLPVAVSDCAPDALQLKRDTGKGSPVAGVWQVNGLQKPLKGNLEQWLDANLQRLRQSAG
ncbi:hypothetical protein [Neptuniibacter halophilus]|uniref:hypothetical protein n=1 Tax=Neptuniibacter halophilus TaxID=651666 RepID=UPI002572BF0B|nr:hypothetical protein [Neptuniibacter halophilus]